MKDAKYYWLLGKRDISFWNMKQLHMQRGEDPNGAEMYCDAYTGKYIEEEHRMSIVVNKRTECISFYASWRFEEERTLVQVTYSYNIEERILEKQLIYIIEDAFGSPGKNSRKLTEQEEIDAFLERHNLTWEDLEEFQKYFFE